MELLHNFVLIQLIPYEGDTVTEGGIIIPKTTMQETDGGSMRSIIDENARFQPKGLVLKASEKVKIEYPSIKENKSIVRVGRGALSTNHQYNLDTTTAHQEWEGLVLIPSGLIEMVENI